MIFTITNDKLTVTEAPEEALALIDKLTTIKNTKFTFERNQKPRFDGFSYESLFDRDTGTCPTGHYPTLLGKCRAAGFATTFVDKRVRTHEPAADADLAWLRDYQHAAIDAAVLRSRGIWHMATGSGKGDLLVALLRKLPTARFLVLVHKANLVRDLVARAHLRADEQGHARLDIGVYGDGSKDLGNRIIIATFQSIALGMNNPPVKALLKGVDALFVDECHTASAANFGRVIRKCVNAYWRIGCSGTPLDRTDKRSSIAVGLLGPVIYELRTQALVDKGVLAKATINLVCYDDIAFESDLWMKVKKIGIQESVNRNAAVVWAAGQAAKPALLFVDTIDHGKALTKQLQRAGMNAEFVWGTASTDQRGAACKRLVRGDIDIIVSSPVFDEGLDLPTLESVVLGGGGKSVIKLLQRIGRGMRKADGKETFQVWDFADTSHKILASHAAERRRVLKGEGHKLTKIQAPTKL